MRGPCACPRPGELIQRVSMKPWRNLHSRGQAQGPHPSPHPPLVPTERRGRLRPDGRDYPLRLEKFIRGEGGGVGKGGPLWSPAVSIKAYRSPSQHVLLEPKFFRRSGSCISYVATHALFLAQCQEIRIRIRGLADAQRYQGR